MYFAAFSSLSFLSWPSEKTSESVFPWHFAPPETMFSHFSRISDKTGRSVSNPLPPSRLCEHGDWMDWGHFLWELRGHRSRAPGQRRGPWIQGQSRLSRVRLSDSSGSRGSRGVITQISEEAAPRVCFLLWVISELSPARWQIWMRFHETLQMVLVVSSMTVHIFLLH